MTENKHIALVKKWLADPESVSGIELQVNAKVALIAAKIANRANNYCCSHDESDLSASHYMSPLLEEYEIEMKKENETQEFKIKDLSKSMHGSDSKLLIFIIMIGFAMIGFATFVSKLIALILE